MEERDDFGMVIVWQEMKKILSARKLLYLFGFGLLYYLMFLKPFVHASLYVSYHEEADIVQSFVEEYGTELTREEWEQLKGERPEYVYGEADRYIAASEEFGNYGIHNLAEFLHYSGERYLSLEEENRLWWMVLEGIPQADIGKEMERLITYDVWDYYIDSYEREAAGMGTMYYDSLDEAQQRRVAERNEKEVYSLLPANVAVDNFEVLRFIGTFMLLAMLFMIMPYMVSENRSRLPVLQYSFRMGRGTYCYRLVAVLLSCTMIAALVTVVYGRIAACNRVTDFWDCSLSAYSSGFISWGEWTLGQYTIFYLSIAAAFALGLTLAVFVVTCCLDNYITAIAWALPAVIVGSFFCGFVMFRFDEITRSRGLVPLAGGVVLGLGMFAVLVWGMRERKRDIQ